MGASNSTIPPAAANNVKISSKRIPRQHILFKHILRHNCRLIEEILHNGEVSDEDQEEVLRLIETNRSYLEAVQHKLSPKFEDLHQWHLQRCSEQLEELRDIKAKHKENQLKGLVKQEQSCRRSLDDIRESMWSLHQEILKFEGPKYGRLYYFLEESFVRYLQELNSFHEIGEDLKYELRAAKVFASDSLNLLRNFQEDN